MPPWLPSIITLEEYSGNWESYFEAVYSRFKVDFLSEPLTFQGRRMGLKRMPISEGREATFWHFISDGAVEADRLPNMRRCERIGWPRAIINNCDDPCLKIWTEERRNESRINIWCQEAEYLLVIADRGEYVLPWTGYPVEQPHSQRKLMDRWRAQSRNG